MWILQLLQDGLRETSDHRLFQRRFVYKILMCHANSSLSDYQTRVNCCAHFAFYVCAGLFYVCEVYGHFPLFKKVICFLLAFKQESSVWNG